MLGTKKKAVGSTRFSNFIRNASASQKKKRYEKVLERASERQRRVIEGTSRS